MFYDELTGVLNRRGFLEEAERVFHTFYFRRNDDERRIVHDVPFSVIFIDIDNFKNLNDTFGHAVGDKVLKSVAKVILRTVREHDIVGRMGGEEFVTALSGAETAVAHRVAERIRQRIEDLRVVGIPKKLRVTASLGITTRKDEADIRELIDDADQAMYRAKRSGKNRVVIWRGK